MLGNLWYYFFVRKYWAILSLYKFTFSYSGEKKILGPTSLACLVSVLTPWWAGDEIFNFGFQWWSKSGSRVVYWEPIVTPNESAMPSPDQICHTSASSSSELVPTANCADTQLQSAWVSRLYTNLWASLWWPFQLLQVLNETKRECSVSTFRSG